MKTCVLRLLLMTTALAVHGQGTVFFSNIPYLGIWEPQAPVYMADGVTLLSGPQFTAELLAGSDVNSLFSIAAAGFLTGPDAGYFASGRATVNGVAPQATAWVKVRVWNNACGPSFLQAQASGLPNSWWQSPIFSVVTGDSVNPGVLTGLGHSPVYLNSVPEPSAAGLVGLCAVLIISRKLFNELMKTNRRCLTPLHAQNKCDRSVYAQLSSPAAVAYRFRSATA
jgi:hypothetical protein